MPPPPDLPSLLHHERIIVLGLPIVPQVTELIVSQLLHLNYESSDPITMYLNSPGTNSPDGRGSSYDTEAFAIADTMQYIRAPVATIAIGQAWGTAAMLLGLGQKGQRYALPNASIMLHQPRSRTRGQASDIAIRAKEVLHNRKVTNELLAKACGKELEQVTKDASRTRYLLPEEAVEYGLVDEVLHPSKLKIKTPNILGAALGGGSAAAAIPGVGAAAQKVAVGGGGLVEDDDDDSDLDLDLEGEGGGLAL